MSRTIIIATITAFAVLSGAATAQQDSRDKNAAAKQATPSIEEFDKQMTLARENMKKMQQQMDRIRQTADPQERQKLMQDHWTAMQDNMQIMHGLMGPGAMGCCSGAPMGGHMMGMGGMGGMSGMGGPMMGWGGMRGHYSKLTPEQMKQRQYMTDQTMGMQQMMMDHMMQHQHWLMQPQR